MHFGSVACGWPFGLELAECSFETFRGDSFVEQFHVERRLLRLQFIYHKSHMNVTYFLLLDEAVAFRAVFVPIPTYPKQRGRKSATTDSAHHVGSSSDRITIVVMILFLLAEFLLEQYS